MTDDATQRTLSGDEGRVPYTRPRTFTYCAACGEWGLRRHRFEHDTAAADWSALAQLEAIKND